MQVSKIMNKIFEDVKIKIHHIKHELYNTVYYKSCFHFVWVYKNFIGLVSCHIPCVTVCVFIQPVLLFT